MNIVLAFTFQAILAFSAPGHAVEHFSTVASATDYPPSARAAVLGQELYEAANDPAVPLADILASLEKKDIQEQLKQRALIFADLQLRGLRRYCALHRSDKNSSAEPSYARIPANAFTLKELQSTQSAIPIIKQRVRQDWPNTSTAYLNKIRALKQGCQGAPKKIQNLRSSIFLGISRRPFLGATGKALRSLTQDYMTTMDIESAFPRVQYAVNGLSYQLGVTGIHQDQTVQNMLRFIELYQHFAEHSDDHHRIFDLAIKASQQRPMQALWLVTFAFRNFPHIYDVYLVNPKAAAQLEVLFFRLKYYRNLIRHDDVKMRLHYPSHTYRPGDKRASPYHYWSAGYVAMKLTQKGHRPVLAALLGGMSQVGYEIFSAWRFATQKSEKSAWLGQSFVRFAQRHASLYDASGGMLGAFETISILRQWMPISVDNSFLNLRREAWRLASWVQEIRTERSP